MERSICHDSVTDLSAYCKLLVIVTAVYNGDTDNPGSTSPVVNHVVQQVHHCGAYPLECGQGDI